MKYLKYFESFYSPVKAYKSNIGNDYTNDTGANTYPLNKIEMNEYDVAYKKGQEAFGKDETNIYVDQEYPNTELIKSFNDGLENARKNKEIKESVYASEDGNLIYPEYLIADEEDTLDSAFYKGEEAFANGCDMEENPFIDTHEDLVTAWDDGWMNSQSSLQNSIENN